MQLFAVSGTAAPHSSQKEKSIRRFASALSPEVLFRAKSIGSDPRMLDCSVGVIFRICIIDFVKSLL